MILDINRPRVQASRRVAKGQPSAIEELRGEILRPGGTTGKQEIHGASPREPQQDAQNGVADGQEQTA